MNIPSKNLNTVKPSKYFMKFILSCFFALLFISFISSNAYAENVPEWVKNTAGWWSTDAISENEFVNAIEFLIKDGLIVVSDTQQNESQTSGIPEWVKNNAGWWADGQIPDSAFIDGIEFLIKDGIIQISTEPIICPYGLHTYFSSQTFEIKQKLCSADLFNLAYTEEQHWEPSDWVSIQRIDEQRGQIQINSHGFRGSEFSIEKPKNTYRIFAVGSSPTFGNGVHDSETWPAYLQKIFDNIDSNPKIEILNAGLAGASAKSQTIMIKEFLVDFEPDMILVYDGMNDFSSNTSVKQWKNYWKDACKFGNENDFETVIIVQPLLGLGNRDFSEDNQKFLNNNDYKQKLQNYKTHTEIPELKQYCSSVEDFRFIFNDHPVPIFFDDAHVHPQGNKIIADNLFSLISPLIKFEYIDEVQLENKLVLFPKTKSEFYKTDDYKDSVQETVSLKGINLHGINIDSINFENEKMDYTNFYNSKITNSKFSPLSSNTDFRYAIIDNSIFENVDMTKSMFFNTMISNSKFTNSIWDMSDWSHAVVAASSFINENFQNSDLSYSLFLGNNFENVNFSKSQMISIQFIQNSSNDLNFQNSNLETSLFRQENMKNMNFNNIRGNGIIFFGTTMNESSFVNANLQSSNFVDSSLQNIDFTNANLKNANFTNANLDNINFLNANLENVFFKDTTLQCFNHIICEN